MCKDTILVVDDYEPLRLACRLALEHAGFTVVVAKHGIEALALAQRHLPSLVLLDLDMPVLDGWQTLRGLALDVRTAEIPVVAHTAECLPDRRKLREAGFRAHIDKGTGTRSLVPLVRWLLGQELEHREWTELPLPPRWERVA